MTDPRDGQEYWVPTGTYAGGKLVEPISAAAQDVFGKTKRTRPVGRDGAKWEVLDVPLEVDEKRYREYKMKMREMVPKRGMDLYGVMGY